MSEVTASFMGHPILARHRDFSLYRPAAYVIARSLTDIPNAMLQVSIFSIIFYLMTGFQVEAGKFVCESLVQPFLFPFESRPQTSLDTLETFQTNA